MRIAHIITRLIVGGAQENTLLTCQDLLQTWGDEVLLITGPGLGPEGSLEADARRRGIPLQVLPELRRNIHPWRDWRSYRALQRAIRDFQPVVVHTHSGKAGLLGRSAAWSHKIPAVVHTVHGAPFHPYQGRGARAFFQACERYAAWRCHKLICVADALTDQMVAADIAPREKFCTIYSGMEIEPLLQAEQHRERVRAELGYRAGEVVVGKVARLFPLKGHGDLLHVALSLCPLYPQLRFMIVGGGVLEEQYRRAVEQSGLADRFHFTGLVPPARIPKLLSAMDIVAHCSLREGLARVLPQALLVGRPVISYDIDGAREVVIPGNTGYLLKPQDWQGVAQSIAELAGNAELRQELAATGRQLCRQRFEHGATTRQIRAIYGEILGSCT